MRFVGIDPSTKTGFVALDEVGTVIRAKELTGIGNQDPKRMTTLIDEIMAHLRPDDVVCIEGFGFASQQAIQLGGIGWGIRMALYRRGMKYTEIGPAAVKKFATGKGNANKDEMVLPIYKQWSFEHSSDNVRDAFVLARIALTMSNYEMMKYQTTKAQQEVIASILNPNKKNAKNR